MEQANRKFVSHADMDKRWVCTHCPYQVDEDNFKIPVAGLREKSLGALY